MNPTRLKLKRSQTFPRRTPPPPKHHYLLKLAKPQKYLTFIRYSRVEMCVVTHTLFRCYPPFILLNPLAPSSAPTLLLRHCVGITHTEQTFSL